MHANHTKKMRSSLSLIWFLITVCIAVLLIAAPKGKEACLPSGRMLIEISDYTPDTIRVLERGGYQSKGYYKPVLKWKEKYYLDNFCNQTYPDFLMNKITDVLIKAENLRTPSESDSVTSALRHLMEIDNSPVEARLLSLLCDERLPEHEKYKIWHHFFDKFYPKGFEQAIEWMNPSDSFGDASKTSLLILSGNYDHMKKLLKYYKDWLENNSHGSIAVNTFIALRRRGRLEIAMSEGRKAMITEEEKSEYDKLVDEFRKYFRY